MNFKAIGNMIAVKYNTRFLWRLLYAILYLISEIYLLILSAFHENTQI